MLSLQRNQKLNSLVQWFRKKAPSHSTRNESPSARNDYLLVADTHCDSNLDLKKGNFSWTINNCASVYELMEKEKLKSSPFSAVDDDFKWHLEFSIERCFNNDWFYEISGVNETENKEYISVSFYADSEEKLETCGPLKDADSRDSSDDEMPRTSVTKMFPWSQIKNYIFHDKLTIFCEFSFMKNNNVSNISTSLCSSRQKTNFARDFEKLLNDEDFSDVTISIKGKDYPAHKSILAARSSTFNAMFKSDMRESTTNRVDIEDIEPDTFEEMLRYIYTGKSKNLGTLAFELLPVAEKYDIKDLKIDCEQALFEKLSRENVVKILILADMHNADQLRTQTLQFIKLYGTHCDDIRNTELFSASTTRPQLMKDVLHVLLEK
ncbi:speckle-type POZ protein-like isoform X2 [Planococcus citri]|uniref:speckle-type POZ protein-like isoform X2 n=1 Tax=Planococcus citri TaxID=170843 RepID=UPI0031F75D44